MSFTDSLVFNVCGFGTTVLLMNLAKSWPKLMKEWAAVELSMISYGWPLQLGTRLKVMTTVFMTIAAGKYLYRVSQT